MSARGPSGRAPPGYDELARALQRPGCPVCRSANAAARRLLAATLHESVNDPGTRQRLRDSYGYCRDHALVALDVARGQADALGIALLYGDLLRHVRQDVVDLARRRRRWGRRRPPLRPAGNCPACEAAAVAADRAIELLADAAPDSELGAAARQDHRGVCLPHLRRGVEHVRSPGPLIDIYLRGEEQLRAELEEFVRKQDTRARGEPDGAEATAWRRAVYWLVGIPPPSGRARD